MFNPQWRFPCGCRREAEVAKVKKPPDLVREKRSVAFFSSKQQNYSVKSPSCFDVAENHGCQLTRYNEFCEKSFSVRLLLI